MKLFGKELKLSLWFCLWILSATFSKLLILKICCKACKDTSLLTPEAQKIIEEAKEMGYLK